VDTEFFKKEEENKELALKKYKKLQEELMRGAKRI
jgi:hypothetical protein